MMTTVGSETMSPSLLRSVLTDGAFNVPNHNTKIFKDECMYCFHNPFFTGGLYVCLKTFTCFCQRHVLVFATKSGNSLFLQIESWKIPIGMETNSGEPKGKITRLAIGVNSGFDNQKYEVKDTYHITAYPNLDRRSEIVQDLGEDLYHVCQLVINSTSAERLELLQNASNAWDGEIKQITKHANIQQLNNGKKVELNDWKCEADGCGLTENLWLNLTDGSIRCGRSQFVAEGEISKGNNHMKQYYDATGFPLVVKLGTISMEGTADVYSYDEDDAVIDPNLDKHLAHFGIDPCRLKKTEKSTLEMELDMNQKWEWAKCQEDGASLESIFGPGYTGLINIGSSCYMNSVLQSLLLVPEFRLCFCDGAAQIFSQLPSFEVYNDFNSQVAKLFSALMSGDYAVESDAERNGVKPLQFKRVVAGSHVEFSTARQQDSEEYVRFLFDRISSNTPAGVEDPTYSMRFKMETRFEDISSGRVRYSDRDEIILAVPVPQSAMRPIEGEENRFCVSMSECLNSVFLPEIIEGFTSPITGESKGASNTIRFKTFPDFLMVQIQKFTMAPDFTVKKLDINLQVEEELNLNFYRGVGKKESEQLLPNDVFAELPSLPEYDKNIATQLEAMGFSHNASIKAVIETRSSGVEAAAEWVMMHLDDPTLNDPPRSKCSVPTASSDEFASVEQLVAFGFTTHQARYALKRNADANAAAEWLFLNAHEVPAENSNSIEDSTSNIVREMKDGTGKYELVGFISHMGSSPHSGHYVAHIKKEGKWILFNDEKVAISQNPPKQLAYLYLYKRLE